MNDASTVVVEETSAPTTSTVKIAEGTAPKRKPSTAGKAAKNAQKRAKAKGTTKAVKVPVKKAAKGTKKKAAKKKAATSSNGQPHDGKVVGYGAKSKEDVKWSKKKVAFYKAMKRRSDYMGTSAEIAKASNGSITEGNARHFGYHGVGGGLVSVKEIEGVRGFTFQLTAKGRNIDPEAELKKQQERQEKAKAGK